MELFIRYMPVQGEDYDPRKHSQAENEERLFSLLLEFLTKEKALLS